VLGLMAGGLANFSLMYYVQPLLPLLARHYRVSTADSAHALSATTLTMAFGLLLMGPLADRIGRVRLMRWSLLTSGVIGIVSALIPSWDGLVIVRALLGLSLAGFPVAALAYLREEVLAADHLRTNAAYIAGTALGGAVGRLLPGPLAELGGWPLASLVMSGITLSAGLALVVLLPPSRRFEPHRPSTREVLLGVISAPRDPVVALLCVAAFVANGTFVGVYNAIGFRLQAPPFSLGVSASLLYLAYPIGIAAPGIARRLADRTGRGVAAVITFAALGVAVVAISLPSLVAMFIGLGAVTFVFLGLHSLLSGWVVDRARRRGRGTAQASGAYLLAFYTGSTLAGALATSLWAGTGWLGVELMGLVLCAIGVGVAALANSSDRDAVRPAAAAEPEVSDTAN
jgi:YNFM family putative membrane transporter